MKELKTNEYKKFLKEIISNIENAKIQASYQLNAILVELNYRNGKLIIEKQEKYGWGSSVIKQLSKDLNKIYDGLKGYSVSNLQYMRQFYLEYKDNPILLSHSLQIPWTHNILIIQKIKDFKKREYYLKAVKQTGWNKNVLLNQIKSNAYEHYLKNPKLNNFNETLPEHLAEQANENLKSVYNLDFLGITKPVLERKLENMMVEKIRDFLIELGNGFAFIGSQYKIKYGGEPFFIDLLFYNRKLNCLFAIELKTGKFQSEYISKLNLYLEILDETEKEPNENPAIGIILCAEKNDLIVELALRNAPRPIGVAGYQLAEELPKKLKEYLPTIEELKTELINNEINKKR